MIFLSNEFCRLSDFFFVAARFAAQKAGKPEVEYVKHVERFHSHLRTPTVAAADAAAGATAATDAPAADEATVTTTGEKQ